MLWCWEHLYQFRPTFKEVKQELTSFQASLKQSQTDSNQENSDQNQGTVDLKCTLCEEQLTSSILLEQHEVNVHGYITKQTLENNERNLTLVPTTSTGDFLEEWNKTHSLSSHKFFFKILISPIISIET